MANPQFQMRETQPYYRDYLGGFGLPATSPQTAPGSPAVIPPSPVAPATPPPHPFGQNIPADFGTRVPTTAQHFGETSFGNVLEQFGGQQQGSLGERLAGRFGGSGFADPTLGNIARSIMTGLQVASPMGWMGLVEGLGLKNLGLPGYASSIGSMLASALGLPGPISLTNFSGWGAYPKSLVNQLSTATNPTQIQNILSQLQHYQELQGAGAGKIGFGGRMAVPAGVITGQGAYPTGMTRRIGERSGGSIRDGGAPQGGLHPGGHGEY